MRVLLLSQALTAIHADEDFQQDLLRLPLDKIVEDAQKHPSHYAKCDNHPCCDVPFHSFTSAALRELHGFCSYYNEK